MPPQRCGWLLRPGPTLTLLALTLTGLAYGAAAPTESQVEAVFVFNFSHFVEWPAEAFGSLSEPFVIGILGGDPFAGRLDEAVQGEQVNGRALQVRRFKDVSEIRNCQILYIDRSEAAGLGAILSVLDHRSILTVSDVDDASARGVM